MANATKPKIARRTSTGIGYTGPQIPYLLKDLHKEIIIGSLKRKVLKGPGRFP